MRSMLRACVRLATLTIWLAAASACSSGAGAPGGGADAGDGFEPGADAGFEPEPGSDGGGTEPDAGTAKDPCEGVAPLCPSPAGLAEGGGLVEIDRCAVPLQSQEQRAGYEALIDQLAGELEVATVADVLGDLNRSGTRVASVPGNPAGLQQAFEWQSGDMSVDYWTPQGITSSGDAVDGGRVAGRHVVLASWHHSPAADPGAAMDKGVRIAITDVTNPADVKYRFVLLVEPVKTAAGGASFKAVGIHAGGLAWFGRYLYVVDTSVGFRIFDLERMMKVSTGNKDLIGYQAGTGQYHAHDYAYILPQVETVAHASECSPRFSFVSIDRTTDPPSLLSGEYDASSINGRLYRWPLDPKTFAPALVGDGRLIADEAFYMAHSHVQGALSHKGIYWLSSSKPALGAGVLYRTGPETATTNLSWNDGPEDLAYDPVEDSVWSLSEPDDGRYVFRVDRAAID